MMNRRATLASLAAVLTVGGVAATVIFDSDDSTRPTQDVEPLRVEWDQPVSTLPLVDVYELADVHANSRLDFDECRSDFVATGADRTVGRDPLYFC